MAKFINGIRLSAGVAAAFLANKEKQDDAGAVRLLKDWRTAPMVGQRVRWQLAEIVLAGADPISAPRDALERVALVREAFLPDGVREKIADVVRIARGELE